MHQMYKVFSNNIINSTFFLGVFLLIISWVVKGKCVSIE